MKKGLIAFVLITSIWFSTVSNLSAQVVSTFAGLAQTRGSMNGMDTAARFTNPKGVAIDGSGNVYVADEQNHLIRKITPAGVVSTLAGMAGVIGHADGSGTAASFNYPSDVAVDVSGNVYVADNANRLIRKISPGGVVSTLAGTVGVGGYTDGTGTAARFINPGGIAVDGSGNIYVADGYVIRKINQGGLVSTLAGNGMPGSANGTFTNARFASATGIAVDGSGNVYVSEDGNELIRKITPGGVVNTLAGMVGISGYTDGIGSAASFTGPGALAVDGNGNVYVADTYNHLIRKITPGGVVSTFAGMPGMPPGPVFNGVGTAASFNHPGGIAVDATGSIIYVGDGPNEIIRKIIMAWPSNLSHLSMLNGDLILYPNPIQDELKIQANFKQDLLLELNFVDMQGRIVYKISQPAQADNNIFKFSLAQVPAGTYVIHFKENNILTHSAKIVKE